MASSDSETTYPVRPTERTELDALEGAPHARVFEGDPLTIRLSLEAGESVPAHQHPEEQIVFHLLEGRVNVSLGDTVHEVTAGEVVRFDGNQDVSPEALEDSTALLVLAPRTADE